MPETTLNPFDLSAFKTELLNDMAALFEKYLNAPKNEMIRSNTVKQMLGCSDSKLETLRKSGKLGYTKILGTIYYNKAEVERLFLNPY
jgi:hypothetical protein